MGNPMKYSVAMTTELNSSAREHLFSKYKQEELCFAIWHPSNGVERQTALISQLILPEENERKLHGNVSYTSAYFERALGEALKEGAGLAFLHSHFGKGWQGMSNDDMIAESRMSASVMASTGHPLVGLTAGIDESWSARVWRKIKPRRYGMVWCEDVRIVGEYLDITYMDELCPPPKSGYELLRTVSAWGEKAQAKLSRIKVGIIGVGSVGSIVAEAMARMGGSNITLIDFDSVERKNLDRLLNVTSRDIGKSKVKIISKAINRNATSGNVNIKALEWSIVEEEGYRAALDCDILFCCVDRPLPRSILNFIAYAHLIPVVDGGIRVKTKEDGTLRGADWKTHIIAPGRKCLECLGQYDPGLVSVDRDGFLDDPTYIESLGKNHKINSKENVFGFGLNTASFEVLQFLSFALTPNGLSNNCSQNYHFTTGELKTTYGAKCDDNCFYQNIIGTGEDNGFVMTGRHIKAEQERFSRSSLFKKLVKKFKSLLKGK